MGRSLQAGGIGIVLVFMAAAVASAKPCDDLKGMKVSGGTVVAAARVDNGMIPGGRGGAAAPATPLPRFCRVSVVLSSGPGSTINVEIWLPDAAQWNGNFLGTGNGGFAGSITTGALVTGLRSYYATANTDMGTAEVNGNYNSGVGKPEIIKDWGWRSTHAMTLAGKEITRAYYEEPIKKSLFSGCSTGGHQALMEAQRFPEDYDGILAGAAGNNRIGLHLAFLYYTRVAQDTPGYWFSPAQATAIRRAVIARGT